MSLRLAVATEDFAPSLKKAIGLAAACKVAGIRLNTRSEVPAVEATESSLRQVLLYVRERQLNVAGLSCPTRHALHDPEYLEPRIDIIRKSMSLARKLETSELLIRCGRIPDPDVESEAVKAATVSVDEQANPFSFATPSSAATTSPAAEFSLLCEILNDLAQHGNHVGCVLNLQLATYDLRLIKRLLSEVQTGPIGIVLDPATAVMTGANVTDTYRDLYQNVGYVRARDAVRDVDGAGVEIGIGDGVVDWVQLLPTLAEADYNGWICVERTGGDTRADDVRRGVSHLKTLIPQTGD
ncbi:MAG: sugar phosphate isomerase/epimerase [Fuerstiella sp.]|nr:sugar phosphate isomerase/epimerase [Fuerstiella sp.]